MQHFWQGFEKCALNAAKARALASQHGLIPEGSWKWALRNLRNGKTKEQLGQAPKAIMDAVRKKGKKVEVGKLWGKGSRGKARLHVGTDLMVDLGGEGKALLGNKTFMSAAHETMGGVEPREMLKAHGRLTNEYRKHVEKTKHLNTIHSHPLRSAAYAKKHEVGLAHALRNPDHEMHAIIDAATKGHPLGHRLKKIQETNGALVAENIERRYSSSKPELTPSGFKTRSPYNVHGADLQRFLLGNVGTHHNIVSPGSGVGIYTVRPNKATGEKQLRSVLFKEGKK